MAKLSNLLKGLTSEELEELIEMANELKAEKEVKLIGVYDGILALKYFKLEDKENAISYAHESFDKQLEKERMLFEKWLSSIYGFVGGHDYLIDENRYVSRPINGRWSSWLARAELDGDRG